MSNENGTEKHHATAVLAFKALWRMLTILTEEHQWPFVDLLPTNFVQPILDCYWSMGRQALYQMTHDHGLLQKVADHRVVQMQNARRIAVYRVRQVRVQSSGSSDAEQISDELIREIIAKQNVPILIQVISKWVASEVYDPPNSNTPVVDSHIDRDLDQYVNKIVMDEGRCDQIGKATALLDSLSPSTIRKLAGLQLEKLMPVLNEAMKLEVDDTEAVLKSLERQRTDTGQALERLKRIRSKLLS